MKSIARRAAQAAAGLCLVTLCGALATLLAAGEGDSAAAPATRMPEVKHRFAGMETCSICHLSRRRGNQVGAWQETAHAKGYTNLATEKYKAVGKEVGVDDPQKSEKCLRCHTTAYGVEARWLAATYKREEGVTCEACHGPGEDFALATVMPEKQKAVALGLYEHPEASCTWCHNEQSPTWKAGRYVTKDGSRGMKGGVGEVFVGVDNLFDAEYEDYGVVGFFDNEFYPAPDRRFYAGVKFTI